MISYEKYYLRKKRIENFISISLFNNIHVKNLKRIIKVNLHAFT